MIIPTICPNPGLQLHAEFLALLSTIETHGRVHFRHLKSTEQKDDAIAEMVAISWKWFLRLKERGKDVAQFPSVLASFAAKAVRSGRRLCGQDSAKDVLSPRAQRLHGFGTSRLPEVSTLSTNPLEEALQDNMQTPVPDQVAFRQDFPAWQRSRTDRDRRIIDDLMVGERTLAVADKYGLSPARVSQLRNEFHQDWQSFCEEDSADQSGAASLAC
jgi:hypothetical protein